MLDTYIIIVTHNGINYLQRCLDSTHPYPVIVVDNNSSDGTTNLIKDKYPNVELIEEKRNHGFGQANNIGIARAISRKARNIFLLNQDAYLIDNCIKKLQELSKEFPDFGVLSPIHINPDRTKLDRNFSNYISFNNNPFLISDFILKKQVRPIYKVPFVNAAGWFITRHCLQKVGGFDPMFYHYGEDDNFCQRLEFHNFKIGVVPQTFMIHDREDRIQEAIYPHSTEYLNQREKYFKIKKGNINSDFYDFSKEKKNVKKNILKFFFTFRLKLVKYYYKELMMIDRISKEIVQSRKRNKEPSKYYYTNINF